MLYRRLEENWVPPGDRTQLSASTLDSIVRSIKSYHPNDGGFDAGSLAQTQH